jgi:hypothetical protein
MTERLAYSLIAAYGHVLLQWPRPIRVVRLPWPTAYELAKHLVAYGQRAEIQAGLSMDRTTPAPTSARFTPAGGDVGVDWGAERDLFDWSPAEAFAIANALVETGEIAQRWATRGPGMTPKEVDKVEEALVGEPALIVAPAPPPPPVMRSQFVPMLKQTYYYRPAECNARVLTAQPEQHRANILLPTGRILEGVAWSDLLAEKPRIGGKGISIKSTEAVSRPTLSGG